MPMTDKPAIRGLTWETVCAEFEFDGSWRDIYVFETTHVDWTRLLRWLGQSAYPVTYTQGGEQVELPLEAAEAFPLAGQCDRLLSVNVAGAVLNAHFFDESEIEFDLDPREITSQHELDGLLGFLRGLANIVGKDAVMTPENCPRGVIFRARPGDAASEYTRPTGAGESPESSRG